MCVFGFDTCGATFTRALVQHFPVQIGLVQYFPVLTGVTFPRVHFYVKFCVMYMDLSIFGIHNETSYFCHEVHVFFDIILYVSR